MIKMTGKMPPARRPAFRLLPKSWEMFPTSAGPAAPPKSPDMASIAKSAVPPLGILGEQTLIVPGHMIATEKPQRTQPKSPKSGRAESDASR